MSIPVLTYTETGSGHRVDLDRLVASRMLVQANSGGGKSRAIRQLLEQTFGRVQHLVIDPEGEFATLRERFDYVLAAKTGGDTIASARHAKLLCRRLMELGASAVLDLYDLEIHERREFVKVFLTELVNLPREMWHPALVVIDEAHLFAPQVGESQALAPVVSLCTLGRKRGLCAVLATQRISKLHKDAAAELLNKMIGRTGLDVDVKRAADELGFDKESRQVLPRLEPGQFYVYGPAISPTVTLVRTGDVVTTHPTPGQISAAPPPPPNKVKAMLAQLADLPKEAEEEARTIDELRRANAELSRKLRQAESGAAVREKVVERTVVDERAIARAVSAAVKPYNDAGRRITAIVDRFARAAQAFGPDVLTELQKLDAPWVGIVPDAPQRPEVAAPRPRPTGGTSVQRATSSADTDGSLSKGEKTLLIAIAQYPDGAEREQLTVLTGYKRSSRDTYIQRLSSKGYVASNGNGSVTATEPGIDALGGDYEPLPTGTELQRYWLNRLGGGEKRILEVLLESGGEPIARADLDERVGYQRSSRDTYLQRLASRRLVENVGRGEVRASPTLFG